YIYFTSGSSSTISNANIRYGGYCDGLNCVNVSGAANIMVNGGKLNLSNSRVSSSSVNGIAIESSPDPVTITSSTFSNNGTNFYGGYGIYETGSSGNLTVTTSTFLNSYSGVAY